MKIFLKSFTSVCLVSINTVLISKGIFSLVFIVSFFISLVWTFNVSKVAVSTMKEKIIYSFGGAVGAITGMALVKILNYF